MRRYNLGFGILESMLVLAMLAVITLGIVQFNTRDAAKKDAKVLSAQTEAFAMAYAKYMKDNYDTLVKNAQTAPITLSPQAFSPDIYPKNMYGQIPCVTIVKNTSNGILEALMYYVGGSNQQSALAIDITRSASIWLGGKGGILLNGMVRGNSGWQINSDSPFLSGASQCGGALANNSLAVNLDLLLDWNQALHPLYALLRGTDMTFGQQSLPGRLKNANTLKSNLYLESSAGIILDNSNPASPVKLSVQYDGNGTGAPTLGLGSAISTKLVGDTLQPNLYFQAGQACNPQEEGKTAIDQGLLADKNQLLARNTLVCTQSNLLCGQGNYCYLTSTPNKITFQNTIRGIQNPAGQFFCPKEVPFAISVKTSSLGGGVIYSIVNKDGKLPPSKITAKLNKNGIFTHVIDCPMSGCNPGIRTDYSSGIIDGVGELISVDLATVTGNPVGVTIAGGAPDYMPIQGKMGNYTTPIGFSIDPNIGPASCKQVCTNLGQVIGNSWQLLGQQRKNRVSSWVGIDNQNLGCACERTDFSGSNPDNYNGIAVISESVSPSIIVSATCSNMPLYDKN